MGTAIFITIGLALAVWSGFDLGKAEARRLELSRRYRDVNDGLILWQNRLRKRKKWAERVVRWLKKHRTVGMTGFQCIEVAESRLARLEQEYSANETEILQLRRQLKPLQKVRRRSERAFIIAISAKAWITFRIAEDPHMLVDELGALRREAKRLRHLCFVVNFFVSALTTKLPVS